LLPLLILSSFFSQKKKKEKTTNKFFFIHRTCWVRGAKQGLDNSNPI
jgi:hypothetical protein